MIKVEDTQQRISIFKHPVISIRIPSAWINEAISFDWNKVSEDMPEWLKGFHGAKRIAKRAFAAYYGLQTQFQEKHSKHGEKGDFDYLLTSGTRSCYANIHCLPVKDYNGKIGKDFSMNIYSSKNNLQYPIVHIMSLWWCPIILFIGWVPNSELNERGKTQITDEIIYPIHEHEILSSIDTKGMFI